MASRDIDRFIASSGRIAAKIGMVFASHGVALPLVFGEEIWNGLTEDLRGRQLSWVEAERLSEALPHAEREAQRRLDEGQQPTAAFRAPVGKNGRTAAAQLIECGLLAAAEAQDDRKAEFIGNLVGGIGFLGEVDFGQATEADGLQIIQVAREISYRQYVLLALVQERQNQSKRFTENYVPDIPMVLGPMLLDLDDLYRRGLIAQGSSIALHPLQIKWLDLHITGAGAVLHDLLGLHSLDATHKSDVLDSVDVALRTP
ncbi:MAG: hypothetical protein JWR63_3076 [Conexibacter sp.]|nr:hypothetical protein [Conexibacter sp.]